MDIGIIPFTDLQSPDASSVYVNIYVWSDNMQFNQLCNNNLPTERRVYSESSEIQNCIQPVEVSCIDLNPSTANNRNVCHEYFGEQPLSFRSLLKRFMYNRTVTVSPPINAAPSVCGISDAIFPINNLPYGATGVNSGNIDMFSYLRLAYLGFRGGIKYRSRYQSVWPINQSYWTFVSLGTAATTDTAGTITYASTFQGGGINGTEMFSPNTNCGVEYELPFYNTNLFLFSFSTTKEIATGDIMSLRYMRNFVFSFDMPVVASVVSSALEHWCSSGEDFSFLRFQGAPMFTV